ncbi:cysteine-rich motor neuron 1 protein-like isoform X23 [Anneissia japonica]|uniref:cysteine-rich motor neuron 1 protein-like isoform X20 n=1 Tax=Anneissia japonica TaxID=1529436 RepID=UPI0014257065|nr:cysteine-rich motor neuron 1 protein-like isoform X20 [Anneissia japonica]XP_033095783.1 cysteine-rich motor neuron 1 protein-like isoform X23 [Anneissia japonica]
MLPIFLLVLLISSTSAKSCEKVINFKKQPSEGRLVQEFSGDETDCVFRFIAPSHKHVVIGILELDIFSPDATERDQCKLRLNVRDTPSNGKRHLLRGYCDNDHIRLPHFFRSSESRMQLVYKGEASRTDGRLEVQYAFVDHPHEYIKSLEKLYTTPSTIIEAATTETVVDESVTQVGIEPTTVEEESEVAPTKDVDVDVVTELAAVEPTTVEESDKCGIIICYVYCEAGYVKDENGCHTCTCIPESEVAPTKDADVEVVTELAAVEPTTVEESDKCGTFVCYLYCPAGYVKDENGCYTCNCTQVPDDCGDFICSFLCPAGYLKDENGCPTCSCVPEESEVAPTKDVDVDVVTELAAVEPTTVEESDKCGIIICYVYCEAGYVKDKNGCHTCTCIPESEVAPTKDADVDVVTELAAVEPTTVEESDKCGIIICYVYCEDGYVKDENGCHTCTCIPESEVAPTKDADVEVVTELTAVEATTVEESDKCGIIICYVFCEAGYVKDENGCHTCTCIAEESEVAPTKDADVEVVTELAAVEPTTVEESDKCGIIICYVYCEAGYVKDENGCHTCACKQEESEVSPTKDADVDVVTELAAVEPTTVEESDKCGIIICYVYCEAGYVKDENGCHTCTCIPEKVEVAPTEVEPVTVEESDKCGIIICYVYCPSGYVEDENGCNTCACKQEVVTSEPETEDLTVAPVARCLAARQVIERGDFLPDCDENGDYEPLQCPPVGGCICVNKSTGEPTGLPSGDPPVCNSK